MQQVAGEPPTKVPSAAGLSDGKLEPISQATWRALWAALARFVARRVAREDRDDVLQEVFVRAQRGLGELRDGERLTPWMYQIARNTIADHHRRAGASPREVALPDELDRESWLSVTQPADAVARGTSQELVSVLRDFVGLLPDSYREALELTDLLGQTQAEASRRVGLSLPGMKARVQRARAQLRALLEACCAIEIDARGRVVECAPRKAPVQLPNCCRRAQ